MHVARRVAAQIRRVRFVARLELLQHIVPQRDVFRLEQRRVLPGRPLTRFVVLTVLRHLVDEEQRQHLDSATEQDPLPLQVRADRLADLQPPFVVLRDVPRRRARRQLQSVGQRQRIGARIDLRHRPPVAVLRHLSGQDEQVVPLTHSPPRFLRSGLAAHLQLHPSRRSALALNAQLHPFDVQVTLCALQPAHLDAACRDLLHELLVVGVQRVQPVHRVVLRLVRRRVPQDHQGIELLQRIRRLLPFHLLRLVQHQDRTVGSDHVDGPAALEAVLLLVDAPLIRPGRVERLHVDDHDIDAAVRGEPFQLAQPAAVVHERPGLLAVVLLEVLRRHREALLHPFADRHTRHHHDELRPAVSPVQLEHRLDVAVGLAGTGLHLHVEVHPAGRRHGQAFAGRQVLPPLHDAHVLQQPFRRQHQLRVAHPGHLVQRRQIRLSARIGYPTRTRVDAVRPRSRRGIVRDRRLACEAIGDRVHRGGLVVLGLEADFHV